MIEQGFMLKKRIETSAKQTLHTVVNLLPIIVGMLLLTGLAVAILPPVISAGLFSGHALVEVLLGAWIGKIDSGPLDN